MNSYDILTLVSLTAIFTAVILVIYKYAFNPQTIAKHVSSTQCPDRWTFNGSTNECEPNYPTQCRPFDPTAITLQTAEAKCNLANTCGTSWLGACA